MNITDLASFYYRNQALALPNAKPQVQGIGARIADTTAINKKSQLYKECEQFEAIFAKMMLTEMRKTVDKNGLVSGGWAEDIYQDMLDDQYSSTLSKSADFGIADELYRQLSKIK
ncbi:MAG: rod-binding protein [Rectinemataceae bacterium]